MLRGWENTPLAPLTCDSDCLFLTSDWQIWDRRGWRWGSASPNTQPSLMDMETTSCVTCRATCSEQRSLVLRVRHGNVKLTSFAREQRAHSEQSDTERLLGVWGVDRQGGAGRCGWEKIHCNSPLTLLLICNRLFWPSRMETSEADGNILRCIIHMGLLLEFPFSL